MDSSRKFSPALFGRALSQVSVLLALDGDELSTDEVEAAWIAAGGSRFEHDVPTTPDVAWSVAMHEPAGDISRYCGGHPSADPYALCVRQLPPATILAAPGEAEMPVPTHELAVLALVAYGCVHAREAFHRQLRRTLAVAEQLRDRGHLPVVWYDEGADRFAPLQTLEALARTPCCPSLRDTFAIRVSGGGGGNRSSWLRTHGLERLGLPELEMIGLPRRDLPLASLLMEVVAEQWLAHGTPSPGAAFSVTLPAVELTWAPSDQLAELSRPSDRPRLPDDWSRAEPERRAVLMPHRPASPLARAQMRGMPPLLRRLRGGMRAICYSEHETERQAVAALHRLPKFLALAGRALARGASTPERWRFLVKMGFGNEHLWFEVLEVLGRDRVRARLSCRPIRTRSMTEGRISELDLRRRLTGWRIERRGRQSLDADDILEIEDLCGQLA